MTGRDSYEPLNQRDMEALFADLLTRITAGDSFEGYVNWLLPDPDDGVPEGTVAMVHARYRVGNSDGSQGGMRVIGGLAT